MSRELRLLVEWESVLHKILNSTEKFPKKVRFSFVQRIDGLVLDITQTIVSAQYSPTNRQASCIEDLNRQLAHMRLLLRISTDRRYISTGLLSVLIEDLDGIGFQANAWLRSVRDG